MISLEDSINRINTLKQNDIRSDYNKFFYTKALTQQYAVNVSGGGRTNSYTFSIAMDRNKGSRYEINNKLNIHFRNVYHPHKKIQVILGVYYTNSVGKSGRPGSPVRFDGKLIPYLRLLDENGSPAAIPTYHTGYTDTVGSGKLLDWNYYPVEDYKYQYTKTNTEDIVSNIGIEYSIIPGLSIDLKYQYQRQLRNREDNSTTESFYTRNLVNTFAQIDYSTGNIKYIVPDGNIQIRNNGTTNSQNFRSQLNYVKQWTDHSVTGIAGIEIREVIQKSLRTTLYGHSNDPLVTANVDYINQYPTLIRGTLNTIPGAPSLTHTINRFVSVYSNLAYIYKSRYSVSGSVRKDGANILGVNTNEKWKPLWSAGLGWQTSGENFYKVSLLPYLRLRATYGYSGNLDINRTALPIAGYFNHYITNFPVTQITTLNNPNLQWEESRQLNLAVDFSSRNNTINGTIEYYIKRGENLYGLADYDYTTWGYLQRITKNVASMKGKGIDLRLASKNLDKKVKWFTDLLLNYNSSKVTDYYTEEAKTGISIIGSGSQISPVIGKPLYAIAAYKWAGLNNQGDPQGFLDDQVSADWLNIIISTYTNGIKDNSSVKYIGSAVPVLYGSLINSFSWNKLTLSINVSYKFGYHFQKQSLSYSSLFNQSIGTADFSKRWKNPGDETTTNVPAMVYTDYPQFDYRDAFYSLSEIQYIKGDHIRLQYINLNYAIKEVSEASKIGIRIYANISNVGILWRANKEKLDPDYPTSLVPVKNFAIGMQATF